MSKKIERVKRKPVSVLYVSVSQSDSSLPLSSRGSPDVALRAVTQRLSSAFRSVAQQFIISALLKRDSAPFSECSIWSCWCFKQGLSVRRCSRRSRIIGYCCDDALSKGTKIFLFNLKRLYYNKTVYHILAGSMLGGSKYSLPCCFLQRHNSAWCGCCGIPGCHVLPAHDRVSKPICAMNAGKCLRKKLCTVRTQHSLISLCRTMYPELCTIVSSGMLRMQCSLPLCQVTTLQHRSLFFILLYHFTKDFIYHLCPPLLQTDTCCVLCFVVLRYNQPGIWSESRNKQIRDKRNKCR